MMKRLNSYLIVGAALLSNSGFSEDFTPKKAFISAEIVGFALQANSIKCHDMVHDKGFCKIPGSLSLSEDSMYDRAQRLRGMYANIDIPDSIQCADLVEQIKKIP